MQDLFALRLHQLIVAKQLHEHLLVLGLEHVNRYLIDVGYVYLVRPDFQTFGVGKHCKGLPGPDVFPHFVVLLHENLVEHVVVFALRLYVLLGLGATFIAVH